MIWRMVRPLPAWIGWLALAGLVGAAWGWGYSAGLTREADRRDAQEARRADAALAAWQRGLERGNAAAAAAIEARGAIDSARERVREVIRHVRDADLLHAGAACPGADARPAAGTPVAGLAQVAAAGAEPVAAGRALGVEPAADESAADGARVRFNDRFVRLWNAALGLSALDAAAADPGGAAGAAGAADAARAAPGWVTLTEVLDNHARNAASCAIDRDRLARLQRLLVESMD